MASCGSRGLYGMRWDQRDRRTADRGGESDDTGPSARIGYVRRISCRMESTVRFTSRDHESKEETSGHEKTSGLGIGSSGFCCRKSQNPDYLHGTASSAKAGENSGRGAGYRGKGKRACQTFA